MISKKQFAPYEDVSFEYELMAQQNIVHSNETISSDIYILDGTFSGLKPMNDAPASTVSLCAAGPTRAIRPAVYEPAVFSFLKPMTESATAARLPLPGSSRALSPIVCERPMTHFNPPVVSTPLGGSTEGYHPFQELEAELKNMQELKDAFYREVMGCIKEKGHMYSAKLKINHRKLTMGLSQLLVRREEINQQITQVESAIKDAKDNLEALDYVGDNLWNSINQ